jgi:hypothetical protein
MDTLTSSAPRRRQLHLRKTVIQPDPTKSKLIQPGPVSAAVDAIPSRKDAVAKSRHPLSHLLRFKNSLPDLAAFDAFHDLGKGKSDQIQVPPTSNCRIHRYRMCLAPV